MFTPWEATQHLNCVSEMGILVWQDFMFGCGQVGFSQLYPHIITKNCQYPAYDDFVKEVREEAEANVKRLRHHPSIVIFGMLGCLITLQWINPQITSWQQRRWTWMAEMIVSMLTYVYRLSISRIVRSWIGLFGWDLWFQKNQLPCSLHLRKGFTRDH